MAEEDVPPLDDMSDVLETVLKLRDDKKVGNFTETERKELLEKDTSVATSEHDESKRSSFSSPPEGKNTASRFGGMKKGFLCDGQNKKLQPFSESAFKQKPDNNQDDIPFITKNQASSKDSHLRIDEVQAAMKINEALLQNQDELIKNVERNESLTKRILDPSFMRAISEFQANPQEAMEKYKDNMEIQSFFKDFCSVLGDHLTVLGDQQEASNTTLTRSSQVQLHSDASADLKEVASCRYNKPTVEEEEEDKRVMEILSDPEIKSILLDSRIRQFMDALRNDHEAAERLLRSGDRELQTQIQKLVAAGLLQVQM